MASDEERKDPEWRSAQERGSVFALRALIVFTTMFGRPFGRAVVYGIAFYYTVFSSKARKAVRDYRSHLGLTTGFADAYRQILRFAQCAFDTLFLIRGKTNLFRVTRRGHEHLAGLRDAKRGAILLGAHVGSFSAMRASSRDHTLPLSPVVYTKHARKFNDVVESLDPSSRFRLIEMSGSADMEFMLAIRERLDEGGLVAILGDRVQDGAKNVTVDFLGGKARLPTGPYLLASMLKCPVYFTAGLYRGGNHYELLCIPFAERVELPRGKREEALQRYAQQYADQVAELCREAPDNWFNFYDFWTARPDEVANVEESTDRLAVQ